MIPARGPTSLAGKSGQHHRQTRKRVLKRFAAKQNTLVRTCACASAGLTDREIYVPAIPPSSSVGRPHKHSTFDTRRPYGTKIHETTNSNKNSFISCKNLYNPNSCITQKTSTNQMPPPPPPPAADASSPTHQAKRRGVLEFEEQMRMPALGGAQKQQDVSQEPYLLLRGALSATTRGFFCERVLAHDEVGRHVSQHVRHERGARARLVVHKAVGL